MSFTSKYGVAKYGLGIYGTWDFKTDFGASDYYNYWDLNRVEVEIQKVKDAIELFTSSISLSTRVTSRTNTTITFYDDLNRIENDILTLKNNLFEPLGWSPPKTSWVSLDKFGMVDANRLENNLKLLYDMAVNVYSYLMYSGEARTICGNDNTYL